MAVGQDEHIYGFAKDDAKSLLSIAGKGTESEVILHQRVMGSKSGGAIFLTPGGGIGARSGSSSPWTPGTATCTLCEYYDDSGTIKIRTTSTTATVYNMVPASIGAGKLIQAKLIGGRWTVDVEPC